jgi:hypothetical protein
MSRVTRNSTRTTQATQQSQINLHIKNIANEAVELKIQLEEQSTDNSIIIERIREFITQKILEIQTTQGLAIPIHQINSAISRIERARNAAIIEEDSMTEFRRTNRNLTASEMATILRQRREEIARQNNISIEELNSELLRLNTQRVSREREEVSESDPPRAQRSTRQTRIIAPTVPTAPTAPVVPVVPVVPTAMSADQAIPMQQVRGRELTRPTRTIRQIMPGQFSTPNDERIELENRERNHIENVIKFENNKRIKLKKSKLVEYINSTIPELNYDNLMSIHTDLLDICPQCKCLDIIISLYDTLINLAIDTELKLLYTNINLQIINKLKSDITKIIYGIVNELNKCIKNIDNAELINKLKILKSKIGNFKNEKIDYHINQYELRFSKLSDSISSSVVDIHNSIGANFFQNLHITYSKYKDELLKIYSIYYHKDTTDDCIDKLKTKLSDKIKQMFDKLKREEEWHCPDIIINSIINKSQLAILFDFWCKYPDKDNLFLRYFKSVKINQYTDDGKTIAVDMGGPMRQFILSIMEEINASSILTCLEDDIREEKESYYLNKKFEFSKEFKQTILFLNMGKDDFKFDSDEYKVLFFKFFGGFLTFCIINNFTLPKRISSVILSSLIYFNNKLRIYDDSSSESYKLFYLWYDKSDIFYKLGNLLKADPKELLWEGEDDYQDDMTYTDEEMLKFNDKYKFFTDAINPRITDKNKPITRNNIIQFFINYSAARFPNDMEKYYNAIAEGFNINLKKCLAENKTPLYLLDIILSKTYTITIEEVEKFKAILTENMKAKIARSQLSDEEITKTNRINDYFKDLLSGHAIKINDKTLTKEEYLDFISKLLIFWSGWNHIIEADSNKYFFIVFSDSKLLPVSHTCSFQLDIPPYKTKDEFIKKLYTAVTLSGADMNLMGGGMKIIKTRKYNRSLKVFGKTIIKMPQSKKYYRSKIVNKLKKILYKD